MGTFMRVYLEYRILINCKNNTIETKLQEGWHNFLALLFVICQKFRYFKSHFTLAHGALMDFICVSERLSSENIHESVHI